MFPQVSVIVEIQLSGVCHFKNMAPKFLDILLLRSEGQFPLPESGQVCKSFSRKNSNAGPLERLTLGEAGVTCQTPRRLPCYGGHVQALWSTVPAELPTDTQHQVSTTPQIMGDQHPSAASANPAPYFYWLQVLDRFQTRTAQQSPSRVLIHKIMSKIQRSF